MALGECTPWAKQQVERWAELMAKHRLTKLEWDGMVLEMSLLGFSLPEPEPVSATNDSPEGERVPTDEELTLWSAGGPLPDVKAEAPKE